MNIGDNSAAVLRAKIDSLVQLEQDLKGARSSRKEALGELRSEDLPVKEILALRAGKEIDVDALRTAGAVLNIPVLAEYVEASDLRDAMNPEVLELVQERLELIDSLDEEIAQTKEAIKGEYDEIKSAGLSVPVVRLLVSFQLDPEKEAKHTEHSTMVDTYKSALNTAR